METQMKNNGILFNPLKKLFTGIFLLASFFVLFYTLDGADGIASLKEGLRIWLSNKIDKDLALALSSLAILPLPVFMVYAAVSGTYRIFTFGQYIPTFEDKTPGGIPVKGCDSYKNINRILSYRESKMAGMTPVDAANLYVNSSKIESLYTGYNNGPNTLRTLSFIESKLSGMTPEGGLNYLANKL